MSARVGIIGMGYWGKNILRNMHDLGCLALACDSSDRVVAEKKAAYPGVAFTTSIDEVILGNKVDAVVIAAPAAAHFDLVKKSLLAGKDVFVEKPLALRVSEGEELVKIAKDKRRILMVGHILQYHPAIIKLKTMIHQGELGKIEYIYSNRLNIGKLRVEENIIWSFAPHDISVILALLGGDNPVRIKSAGGNYLTKGVYDVTMTSMTFPNNISAHVFVSWLHPFKEQKLVVIGSQAMVVFDDITKEKLFLYPHQIKWEDGKVPVAQKADFKVIPVEEKEPLKEELLHFLDCIEHRKQPLTNGEEGLRVLRVLNAIEADLER